MPAYPSGTVEQQVLQQYSYLFQMAQQLNLALEAAESSRTAAVQAAGKNRAAQGTEQEYQNLKSLIIKTADTVQRRMDQLSARLEGEYVASSEFGSYVEKLSAYIEAHPDALTQYYSFCSDLQGDVDAVDAAFRSYKAGTEGYIRTGVVYYEGALPGLRRGGGAEPDDHARGRRGDGRAERLPRDVHGKTALVLAG